MKEEHKESNSIELRIADMADQIDFKMPSMAVLLTNRRDRLKHKIHQISNLPPPFEFLRHLNKTYFHDNYFNKSL